MRRRTFVGAGLGAVLAGCSKPPVAQRPTLPPSAVAIVKAGDYSANLADAITRGVAECGLDVRGKRILLKPNLVEFSPSTCINTHPAVVGAALEVFRKLGAAEVMIGEGPGHRRDAFGLAEEAGYRTVIPAFEDLFTDLNRDDVAPVEPFESLPRIYFSEAILKADLIVSMAKMKTHHWAGATLSMKNLFGLVPGSIYGWPKNTLHWVGIDKSIAALNRIFRKTFAIVDGVVGMEGDGPIRGVPKPVGVLVMGRDVVAVDATCCRIMGIDPTKVEYLNLAADLGNIALPAIQQRGERIESVQSRFALLSKFDGLRP